MGGLIFRIALDDLDDGNCQISFRFWYENNDPYISPVQNAGSTMHLATHVPGAFEGDNLRIYSVADSSNTLEKTDKDIENFRDNDGDCPLPNGQDPCEDQHSGRMSGFRSGNTIGWLWMGDDENSFPFPHVRVAVFETRSLDKVLEHQIWSNDLAWQLPTVGVNEDGDVGVLLYAMGGGRFPKIQGFIRTNPRDWSGIQMTGIASSDSGPPDGDGDGRVSWGHYGAVREYGNCPETFLGSAYTIDAGTPKGRFIWFGKDGDGCADLVVTSVSTPTGRVRVGGSVTVTATVQNQGSGLASSSFLGYYLSRDRTLDDDDVRFESTRSTNALDPLEDYRLEATLVVPEVPTTPGDYYLFACADDLERISEVTDTNNCARSQDAFTVSSVQRAPVTDFALGQIAQPPPAPLRPRGTFTLTDTVRTVSGNPAPLSTGVSYSLSSTPILDDDPIPLATRVVGPPRRVGTSVVTTRRLTLPRRVPPGTWRLIGCLRHPRIPLDGRAVNDCRVATRAVTVGGSPSTLGPARSRGGRG